MVIVAAAAILITVNEDILVKKRLLTLCSLASQELLTKLENAARDEATMDAH